MPSCPLIAGWPVEVGKMDQPPTDGSMEAAGEFARDVNQGKGETERLDLGVELVVELVEGCDHVGITAIGPNGVETVAASSEKTILCDQLQYDLKEGPCIDTVRTHHTAISNAVASDPRWPRWGPAVAETYGVGSMLSVLLYTHDDSYGVLNLYSDHPQAYNGDDILTAEALAAHLAVAATNGRELDNRGLAMISRTAIGQAEGILMERFKITAEQAFQMLREESQNTNRKLARIAADLNSTGIWRRPPRAR
jgi:GAF domain-containing protein